MARRNGNTNSRTILAQTGEEPPLSRKAAAKLEKMYQESLQGFKPPQREYAKPMYEDLLLQVLYPNEYVVFRDEWKGRGKKLKLERTILHHAPTFNDHFTFLEDNELLNDNTIHYYFVPDPDGPAIQ